MLWSTSAPASFRSAWVLGCAAIRQLVIVSNRKRSLQERLGQAAASWRIVTVVPSATSRARPKQPRSAACLSKMSRRHWASEVYPRDQDGRRASGMGAAASQNGQGAPNRWRRWRRQHSTPGLPNEYRVIRWLCARRCAIESGIE
ncbi:hypothetical protein F1559_005189 [Cyanidiococcus yangmingshanensis]|uniref:Uncharacterized protein n=1 Tax=Cyanidiococcus yangmingshanensis TaxID=2690220 RepID=A0A7J7IK02_9RHOD|nr:hypothetical protein F1559_005189 [Cyanidiococcus yangmingshanensis]